MKPSYIHSDGELIEALRKGDRKAFEAIYRKYVGDLFRYTRKNISTKEDCEEIVQEVFISLWTTHADANIQSLRPYLFTCVRYKMIRYFQHRSVRRRYADHYRNFESSYQQQDYERPDPDACIDLINKRMAELPERVQAVARMRLNENLSNGEIAQRMKITRKTVENYVVIFTSHFKAKFSALFKVDV